MKNSQLDTRTKIRLAIEALATIWREDAALVRVPVDPAKRRPMCATLADCARCQHDREQLAAMLAGPPE